MKRAHSCRNVSTSLLLGGLVAASSAAFGGAYISSSGSFPDRITHPSGYTGTGGVLQVSVCIDPASESQQEMATSVQNAIINWNNLQPVSPNLFLGGSNDIPSGAVDFESTVVHEIGHCIGLAHPNAATESGLSGDDRNYTKAGQGTNGSFDLDPGPDGIIGSADDLRGDDVNLHWFNSSNNPFVLTDPVDVSNYSVLIADLPGDDTFAANPDRAVGAALGFPNSEAVMQQGAFFDEDQRQLGVDDVAMIRLAASGLDEVQGTADDYQLQLVYGGVQSGCDISVEVSGGSFAFCSVGTTTISGRHRRVTSARVVMGSASNYNWFFNNVLLGPEEIFADGFEVLP
jgi:hypothetical protein